MTENHPQLLKDSYNFIIRMPSGMETFGVFERSREGLLACAKQLGVDDFPLTASELNRFRRLLAKVESEDALWALVFTDLWFCSNFSRLTWEPMLGTDPNYIGNACEACYYVFILSGVDGRPVLSELIQEFRCESILTMYLEELPSTELGLRDWIVHLLHK